MTLVTNALTPDQWIKLCTISQPDDGGRKQTRERFAYISKNTNELHKNLDAMHTDRRANK
jgi:hypothetical protein